MAGEQRAQMAGADASGLGDGVSGQLIGRMTFEQPQGARHRFGQRLVGKRACIERGQPFEHRQQQGGHREGHAIGRQVLRADLGEPAAQRIVFSQNQHPRRFRQPAATAVEDHEPRRGAGMVALVVGATTWEQEQASRAAGQDEIPNRDLNPATPDQHQFVPGMIMRDGVAELLTAAGAEDPGQAGERRSVRISRRRITGQGGNHRVCSQHGPLPPVLHP